MNKPNKLINEKSPYLLQHAHNPVNWFPWSDEAFEKARSEDKPIFLSIGYSTCHWCHVMEKESFEDEQVAKLMNDSFISIKIDREERPDIDGIYMSVCQMMTGSGGWPLTIIMTPDKKPFFAGTYFPKHNRFNRIGMLELVPKIFEVWKSDREKINKSANEIISSLSQTNKSNNDVKIDESIFEKAFSEFDRIYDDQWGGFGNAPKFPSPHNLMFLLRYWKRFNNSKALEIVEKTLTQMRYGGIYDHIGFGFARYSTDPKWLVPHFEKMLYDQAMLVMAYTETYLATKNAFYKKTAEEILEYVLRDMTHSEGGFFSAEDADSEGEEGKFYLWDADELRNILDKDELDIAVKIFTVKEAGNWVDESKGMMPGTNILHLSKSNQEYAKEFNLTNDELSKKIATIRKKLFEYREKRIHPYKDDKILTDWNGLMISALAKAAQAFDDQKFSDAAVKAFRFIEKHLAQNEGRLLHRFRDGESGLPAHIDDYAFMINASIDLYETTFDIKYLERAIEWNNILIDEFWDKELKGFFFTSSKSENLITRQKEIYDGAIPSGNSVALLNMIRLSRFTGNADYEQKASQLIESFSGSIMKSPSVFSQFLIGLDFYFGPSDEIVISTPDENKLVAEALSFIRCIFRPNKAVILNISDKSEGIKKTIPFVNDMNARNGKTTFFVCRNFVCNSPVFNIDEFKKLVNI
jgi:uncharacterized protein YyaL (SSP411 family)